MRRCLGLLCVVFIGAFLFTVSFSPAPALAGSLQNWELVYAHDASGNATYGNISDLRDAVLAGKSVNLVINFGYRDAVIYPSVVFTESDGTVKAYLFGFNVNSANDDIVKYRDLYSTTGERAVTHEKNPYGLTSYSEYNPMSWYVSD